MGSARSRLLVALAIVLGVAMHLPSVGGGFYADDYVLALAFEDSDPPTPLRSWNAFDFGERDDWQDFGVGLGGLPWWTSSDWKVRFLRPLSSLSLALDHALWGDWAAGHHLVSLMLFALLLALAHRLYLRLGLAPGVALLGLALLALSDASVLPVGWTSNRNSLLEALFAVAALLALVGRATAPGSGAIVAALGLASCAALSKESGTLAFALVAAALVPWVRGPGGGRARAGVVAAGLLLVAHVALLVLGGYGTRSLFYATPWHDPLPFLRNLVVLATGGVASLAGPFPLDVITFDARTIPAVIALGGLLAAPLALWVGRELARRPPRERAAAGLLAAWTVLFLLPRASAAPSDRLLFVPSIGACGLLASFLAALRERARAGTLRRPARALGLILLAASTLGSGAWLVLQSAGMARLAGHLRAAALASDFGTLDDGGADVVVLQVESGMQGFTLGATWHGAGGDPRVRFLLTQCAPRALRWTRDSETSFVLESLDAPFLDSPFERVYLAEEPTPASTWDGAVPHVEALPHPSGELRRLRFELDRSLDDPGLRFVRPQEGVLRRVTPPPPGETVELFAPVPALPFVP